MSLYKRGKIYYVKITAPDGEVLRRSTGTSNYRKAREWHDRVKADLWRQHRLGARPSRSWNEAVVQWLTERASKKDIERDRQKLRWLDAHFRGQPLEALTREVIEKAVMRKQGSASTRNRYRALIRAILRACEREWGWLDQAPPLRMEAEPKRRVRFLTREEAERLIAHLPEHLAEMARFACATGIRAGNLLGLRWAQVDMARRVAWFEGEEMKNGQALGVYLNGEARAVLRRQIGKHTTVVFTYQGRPIKQASTPAWYRALKRAGIGDFRWHDWRHTWASWHVQNGTPLYALQEQGGWKTTQMVRRYAHLSAEHFAAYGEAIVGTKKDTPEKSRVSSKDK